jgi:outer membrane immunogenic protein
MKRTIGLLLGTTAIALIPSASASNWSGMYGGINLGYAWSNADVGVLEEGGTELLGFPCFNEGYDSTKPLVSYDGPSSCSGYGDYYSDGDLIATGFPTVDAGSLDLDGATIGVTVGINQQFGNWVVGIEADAGVFEGSETAVGGPVIFSASEGGASAAAVSLPDATELNVELGSYLLFSGRLGYDFNGTLLYGKAGYGGVDTQIDYSQSCPFPSSTPCASAGTSKFAETFAYGVGVEHAISNSMSIKVEYLHLDSEEVALVAPNFYTGYYDLYSVDVDSDTVKVGLNFKFGTP